MNSLRLTPHPLSSRLRAVAAGLACAVLPAVLAAQPVPLGPPFQVNTYSRPTPGNQGPEIAASARGDLVIVWHGDGTLYARNFAADGTTGGPEEPFGFSGRSPHPDPSVSAAAAGAYVTAWTENRRVLWRRFHADGTPASGEVPAAPQQASAQFMPAVARLTTGGHVVVWVSTAQESWSGDVFAQRYDPRGVPVGSPFPVHRGRLLSQARPKVAPLPGGGFVVVWQTYDISGIPTQGIFLRSFDGQGRPRGPELRVDSGFGDVYLNPDVATSRRTGETVVVWESRDSFGHGIFLRRFDAAGQPLSEEIQVNVEEDWNQGSPSVALSPEGDFVVAWASMNTGIPVPRSEVWARWFGPGGAPAGGEIRVDAGAGLPFSPAVALDNAGRFTVVWSAWNGNPEPPRRTLWARRFAVEP